MTTIHTRYIFDDSKVEDYTDEVHFEVTKAHVRANIDRDVQHARINDREIMMAVVIVIDGPAKDAHTYHWSANTDKLTELI